MYGGDSLKVGCPGSCGDCCCARVSASPVPWHMEISAVMLPLVRKWGAGLCLLGASWLWQIYWVNGTRYITMGQELLRKSRGRIEAHSKQPIPHSLAPLCDYVSVLTELGAKTTLTMAPPQRSGRYSMLYQWKTIQGRYVGWGGGKQSDA